MEAGAVCPEGSTPSDITYTATCRWTGYGFCPVLCPEQGIKFNTSRPKRGMIARLSSFYMAYTVANDPGSEAFAGL